MKNPMMKLFAVLLPALGAIVLSLSPASAGESPGKTIVSGFYPTWYFPGHRNCHGTRWPGCWQCGYRPGSVAPWRGTRATLQRGGLTANVRGCGGARSLKVFSP